MEEDKKDSILQKAKDKICASFDKIIDPNDKDRGLKIFGICFIGAIVLLVLISLVTGGGGLANSFGDIVNTYKDY